MHNPKRERREPTKALDFGKKIPLIRTHDATIGEETVRLSLKVPQIKKKKLNIPVCDVSVDDAYESNVPANYQQPECYIRYTKTLLDEPDPSVDYVLDEDDEHWLRTHPRFVDNEQDKQDVARYLTYEHFETIIDIMERATGTSPIPVAQSYVERTVSDRLKEHWPPPMVQKLVTTLTSL